MAITFAIAGFVSVFVVASTFAFTVAQRRREIALLRMVGATPAQVRQMLLGEALTIGVLGSLVGCMLGVPGGGFLRWMLVRYGLAPAWFTVPPSPLALALAVGAGLVVALLGVLLATRRAGKVRAVEALRDAAVDRRVMTASRWVAGGLFTAGGVVMAVVAGGAGLEAATALSSMTAQVLVVGLAALAPLLVPPLAWLAGLLPAGLTAATGLLARQHARAALRRTASTAAPVMVAVAITGSVLTNLATMSASTIAATAERTAADLVVLPAGTPGVAASTVDRITRTPGVRAASPTVATTLFTDTGSDGGGSDLDAFDAAGVDPAAYAATDRRSVRAGALAALRGHAVAISQAHASIYGWRLGQLILGWLGDGTPVRLRVVAILGDALGAPDVLLPVALVLPQQPLADSVQVTVAGGVDPGRVAERFRAELGPDGAAVTSTTAWLAATTAGADRTNRFAVLVMLGMAMLYTVIAIANTLVMAASERSRDLAVLRLAGATVGQTMRALTWETLIVLTVGVGIGAAAAAASVAGIHGALGRLTDAARVVVPWGRVAGVVAACVVVALLASLLPARLVLRQRSVELAGVRE
jgi:putative ABC transport system permease protein